MTAPLSEVAADHYATTQGFVDATAEVAGQMWSQVDPDNIADSWARQLPELTAVVSGAQLGVARQSDAYVGEALEAQDLAEEPVAQVDPAGFAGHASDGRGLLTLLTNPVIVTLLTIADIVDVGRAMGAGRANLDMLVRTQVADAGRLADQTSLVAHPAADGYIRQTDGNPCARCLLLSGRFYQWNRGFLRHPRCGCMHVPASSGLRIPDPRRLYDSMSAAQRLRAGFSRADQAALAEGADIFQIVNARRGVFTAGGRRFTREGTSRLGLARTRLGRAPRLTPDQIFRDATSREHALQLLERNGYILPLASRPSRARAAAGTGTRVRKVFADAATPEEVSSVLAAEIRAVTGRDVPVSLRGSVETAREHAEGVLRGVERFPNVPLDGVDTGLGRMAETLGAYAEMQGRRLVFSERWSSVARRQDYVEALSADLARKWHPYGDPVGMALHEFGHGLDVGYLQRAIHSQVDKLVQRRGAAAVARISDYATQSTPEMIGEAFADVMLHGTKAAPLSREIFDLLDEAYQAGRRGTGAAGVLAVAPRPPSVAQLRARAVAHGVTVPTGIRRPALVKLVDDLDSGVSAQVARDRAVLSIIDERRVSADALVRASEVVFNNGSERALRHVGGVLRRQLPDELQTSFRPLLDALDAGDIARARAAVPVVARSAKLKQVGGQIGDVKPFRSGEMQWIGDSRAAQAYVIRPGYATTLEGTTTVLTRAAVAPASPEQIARLAPAKAAKKAAKKAADPAKKATPAAVDRVREPAEALARAGGVPAADLTRARQIMSRTDRVPVQPILTQQDRFVAPWAIDPGNPDFAWLRRLHDDNPALYNALARERQIDLAWEQARRPRGVSIDEARAAATERLRAAVEGAPIIVRRARESSLVDILDRGRMRTQFETGTSGGLLDPTARAKLEEFTFGLRRNLPVTERPIYGVISPGGVGGVVDGQTVGAYGEIQIVLKPSVRGRTTVTVGDSLISSTDRVTDVRPAPIDAVDWRAAGASRVDLRSARFESQSYIEAQVHGGVRVDDIAEVVFPTRPQAATIAALERAGVAWRVLPPGTPRRPAAAAAKATKKAAPAKKAVAPKAPASMSAPALRKELAAAGVPESITAAVPKPALANFTRRLREGVDPTEETGRIRQAVIDRQRALAEALAEAAELLDNGASATVLSSRASSRLRRVEQLVQGWPVEAPLRALVTAMRTGNPAQVRRAIATAERRGGLRRLGGAAGDSARFDRAAMTPIAGARIADDATVRVVRPGYEVEIGGQRAVISRPVVEEISEAPRIDRALSPDDVLRQEKAAKTQALAAPPTKLQQLPPRGQAAQVLKYYQLHGDQHMNGLLRRGRVGVPRGERVVPTASQVQESIDRLRGLMDESRLAEGITVYRGMSGVRRIFRGGDEPGSLVGRTFRDKGFVSTSADRRVAMQFTEPDEGFAAAEGVLLEIRVPPGVGAIQISNDDYIGIIPKGWQSEREILLEDGLRYRVVSDEMVADVYAGPGGAARTTDPYRHVVVEVIP